MGMKRVRQILLTVPLWYRTRRE